MAFFLDGIAVGFDTVAIVVENIEACASGPDTVYGNISYTENALACYDSYHTSFSTTNCFCVDSVATSDCIFYSGQSNCDNIITVFPKLLDGAISLDLIAAVVLLALAVSSGLVLHAQDKEGDDEERERLVTA